MEELEEENKKLKEENHKDRTVKKIVRNIELIQILDENNDLD